MHASPVGADLWLLSEKRKVIELRSVVCWTERALLKQMKQEGALTSRYGKVVPLR
jgi:hypothetical protein